MRKMTLDEIKSKKRMIGNAVDYAVSRLRANSGEQRQMSPQTEPRDPDEIKALNYISRRTLRTSMNNGTVRYDKERRVLVLAKYTRG